MNDITKNALIGLFVVAATAVVILMILFLRPTVGDDGQILKVRFADIEKISLGTRVTYGGKPVGEVTAIKEIDLGKDLRKPGKDGYIYLYELTLTVDSKVKVFNTDQISSKTSGLLGEKSVEISPEPAKPGEKVYLVNDRILYANETGSVEETLKEFKQLSDKIEETLDSFKFAIDELNKNKFWDKLVTTAKNLQELTSGLNTPHNIENVTSFLRHIESVSDSLDKPDQWNNIMSRIEGATSSFEKSAKNLHLVTSEVRQGKGSLGPILMKDDLYLQIRSVLNKGETVMDDINHYGLLFQNDKRWQRQRARRVNLITRLSTPESFQNYFDDELNEISTSLARLSYILQDVECAPYYPYFMEDDCFRSAFAELLRRVKTMEESLELYNHQVVEQNP